MKTPFDSAPRALAAGCRTSVAGLAVLALMLPCAQAEAQLNRTLHSDGWIVAAAHAPGAQGSIWRTDLWIHSEGSARLELTFCRAERDNTGATNYTVAMEPGVQTLYIEDVVDRFLDLGGGSWVGAIHYVANGGVQVNARVYSISADGSRSYGQLIEGIPSADMSMPINDAAYPATREDQWMFAIKHTADNRYRVNIGMVNPTAVETRMWVSLFDATGNWPAGGNTARQVIVPPYSMVQLSDPFAGAAGGEWHDCIARVEAEEVGSGAFGYASVVDNATNDAYFVRGVKEYWPAP